ncbi:MAG: succinylglutamate desuccinylase/aspartoacylase family protein [Rhodobacteraceae bacterium]|jgi:N-alpha-acetyl-L-2,4-diaminobutyrate deacetylase|nr:succinylglutamate desuccinylase/aspartoacylase family protein [Paracoccaceae bacterium]
MLIDFDPGRRGKHRYPIAVPAGVRAGVVPETLCCISNGEGPTVVLTGGVHGDEYEAQIVLRALADTIGTDAVSGRLIIVPSLNFPASQQGGRVSADDGKNMNRVFPGQSAGSPTDQLAALLAGHLFPLADLLVDVHAGGRDATVVPMVFGFSNARCRIGPAALDRILEAWGYHYIEHLQGIDSTACGAALRADIASVEIEGGGGGRLDPRELAIMRDGILRGLAAAGVLSPHLPAIPFQGVHVTVGPENQVVAPRAGLVEHLCALGDIVAAGQVIARIHPLAGGSGDIIDVASRTAGHVLRQTHQVHLAQGQFLANTGTLRA